MHEDQIKPPKPDNYLVWAILTTILCCLPFGIVSIVYSSKVDALYQSGQYQEAQEKSNQAKKWAIVAGVCGLLVAIAYGIFIAFVGFAAAKNGSF